MLLSDLISVIGSCTIAWVQTYATTTDLFRYLCTLLDNRLILVSLSILNENAYGTYQYDL